MTSFDQLVSAKQQNGPEESPTTLRELTYDYDGIGNRKTSTSKVGAGPVESRSYTPNLLNQYTANPFAANAAMAYDDRGNTTADGRFRYDYNEANQRTEVETFRSPASAHLQGDLRVEYAFDASGRRIGKTLFTWDLQAPDHPDWTLTTASKFVYEGDHVVAEFQTDEYGIDRLTRSFAWGPGGPDGGGEVLLITTYEPDGVTPRKLYRPLYDGQWSVTGLMDLSCGKLVARYDYDPCGNFLAPPIGDPEAWPP